MIAEDLVCDYIVKDNLGEIVIEVRFDYTQAVSPSPTPVLTVEVVVGSGGGTVTFTSDVWFTLSESFIHFVTRAFSFPVPSWSKLIEEDQDVVFSIGGTRMKMEALKTSGAPFERTADYTLVAGVSSVTFSSFDPSGPMEVATWLAFHDAVSELFEINGIVRPSR